MKLVRDARTLRDKSIASLRIAMVTFNSYQEDGRITSVLLHLQHACEMLLNAVLVQEKIAVFDMSSGKSIGFEKCLRICQADHRLAPPEAGIMRTIDAMRDASQHWFVFVSEELLYMHTRALVSAFDDYLKRMLGTDLISHIPPRVLPVSTLPPGDFEFLIDREYKLVADLLRPGKRKRDEARARIRSMLAMEALTAEGVEISERDIDRIERAVRTGTEIGQVFPRLLTVATTTSGEGVTLKVHFSKKDGAPVRYAGGDDVQDAAAVRDVDLRKKYHMSASDLAKVLKLTEPKSKALRLHLGIDLERNFCHTFEFGKSKFLCFSDNARNRMIKAISDGLEINEMWQAYRNRAKS